MKNLIKRASPLAIAVGLALGSASALAQQSGEGAVQPRPAEPAEPRQAQPGQSEPRQAQPGQAQPRPAQPTQPGQAQGQAQRGSDARQPGSQEPARSAQAAESRDTGSASDLDQLAEDNDELSQFVEALKATGLDDALTGGTEYTVFAPTNDALDNAEYDSLMEPENRTELIALLRAHIVADDVDQTLAGQIDEARTIDGGSVSISTEGDRIMVEGNEAKEAGIELGSLRVYAVDEVLSKGQMDTQASLRRDEQSQDQQRQQNQSQPRPQAQSPQTQGQPRPQGQGQQTADQPRQGQGAQPGANPDRSSVQ